MLSEHLTTPVSVVASQILACCLGVSHCQHKVLSVNICFALKLVHHMPDSRRECVHSSSIRPGASVEPTLSRSDWRVLSDDTVADIQHVHLPGGSLHGSMNSLHIVLEVFILLYLPLVTSFSHVLSP